MPLLPKGRPGLVPPRGLVAQEVVHGAGAAAQQRHEGTALGLVEPVGVGEDAQPVGGVGALPVGVGGQRDESSHGVGDVPQAGPRGRRVPVDEGPLVLPVDDEVPRRQVLMGDDVGPLRGNEHLPAGVCRRCEVLYGVVEVPDETGHTDQLLSGFHQGEPVRPDHLAGHEGQHLTPLFVDPEGARRGTEAGLVQVREQRMHRRGPGPRGPANRVADADDTRADVAARQRLLFLVHRSLLHSHEALISPQLP